MTLKSRVSIPVLAVFCLLCSLPVAAQGDQATYFRIGTWNLERTAWSTWVGMMEKHFLPVLEQSLKDGTIVDWGLTTREMHSSDGPTHSAWFGAHNKAALLKVSEALDAVEAKLAAANDPVLAQLAGATKAHDDQFVESVVYQARSGSIHNGYLTVRNMEAKPDQGDAFLEWYGKYIQPVYERLLKDGTIVAFGMDVEEYPTTTPRSRTAWYITASAEGIDKVDAAFDREFGGMSAEERRGVFADVGDLVDEDARRGYLSKVIHYSVR